VRTLRWGNARSLGGTSWRIPGQQKPSLALATTTYISGNAPTFDVLGHYSAGLNADSVELNLDTAIICPQL
jgi:hypothetical protein